MDKPTYISILESILAKMQTENNFYGDEEVQHQHGDQLLLDLIAILAARWPQEAQDIVEAIITNWQEMPRYYA